LRKRKVVTIDRYLERIGLVSVLGWSEMDKQDRSEEPAERPPCAGSELDIAMHASLFDFLLSGSRGLLSMKAAPREDGIMR